MSQVANYADFKDFHRVDDLLDFLADCDDFNEEFDFGMTGELLYHHLFHKFYYVDVRLPSNGIVFRFLLESAGNQW